MYTTVKWVRGVVLAALVAAVMITLVPGCKSTLEPGGAYAPGTNTLVTDADGWVSTNFVATANADKGLYLVDASFDLAYSALRVACKAERDNRDLLWKASPQVKQTFDKVRLEANRAVLAYAHAREAYLKSPTAAGLDTLQLVLHEVERVSAAAQAALPAINQ